MINLSKDKLQLLLIDAIQERKQQMKKLFSYSANALPGNDKITNLITMQKEIRQTEEIINLYSRELKQRL